MQESAYAEARVFTGFLGTTSARVAVEAHFSSFSFFGFEVFRYWCILTTAPRSCVLAEVKQKAQGSVTVCDSEYIVSL